MRAKTTNQEIIQGNNNDTQLVDGRVLKKPNKGGLSSTYEQSYEKQAEQWNLYYDKTPYNDAGITPEGRLSTPFITGKVPSNEEILSCLKQMKKDGWLMLDCRDNNNFKLDENNRVCPVDFGQVYFRGSYKGIFFESYQSKFEEAMAVRESTLQNKVIDIKDISPINQPSIKTGLSNTTKSSIGFMTSLGLGAGLGAVIGTFVFPGIGTAIGAAIGAACGAALGSIGAGVSYLLRRKFVNEPNTAQVDENLALFSEEQDMARRAHPMAGLFNGQKKGNIESTENTSTKIPTPSVTNTVSASQMRAEIQGRRLLLDEENAAKVTTHSGPAR